MLTLGIDLSADARKTAACLVEWEGGEARVHRPLLGFKDPALLDLMAGQSGCRQPDWIGIDAPFGWPAPFVAAVSAWEVGAPWQASDAAARVALRYRATDLYCEAVSRRALSVSTDRLGVTAMRCATLLTGLAQRRGLDRPLDRTGADGVVEVYPAAALPLWSDIANGMFLDPDGYKRGDSLKRQTLLTTVLESAPFLAINAATRTLCEANDDALDALLASLITRAAALGQTLAPRTQQQRDAASLEGWLHLPQRGSLAELAG
jgi:hypothetical protein